LPFEPAWYAERGVTAQYVGHPYFDELPQQRLDTAFVGGQRQRPGRIIGLLPGSRTQEVERNIGTLLRTAGRVQAAQPDTRFLVACYKEAHRQHVVGRLRGRNPAVEVHVGRTPEIIHVSHACVAVSGSVGLELLYHGKPSAVLYRISPFAMRVGQFFKTTPYISLVNLLAGEELFPEYLCTRCEAEAISGDVLRWLRDADAYESICGRLATLRQRVAQPGACARAARQVLEVLAPGRRAAAA
jgi:lipid-A-disaccharide synthase